MTKILDGQKITKEQLTEMVDNRPWGKIKAHFNRLYRKGKLHKTYYSKTAHKRITPNSRKFLRPMLKKGYITPQESAKVQGISGIVQHIREQGYPIHSYQLHGHHKSIYVWGTNEELSNHILNGRPNFKHSQVINFFKKHPRCAFCNKPLIYKDKHDKYRLTPDAQLDHRIEYNIAQKRGIQNYGSHLTFKDYQPICQRDNVRKDMDCQHHMGFYLHASLKKIKQDRNFDPRHYRNIHGHPWIVKQHVLTNSKDVNRYRDFETLAKSKGLTFQGLEKKLMDKAIYKAKGQELNIRNSHSSFNIKSFSKQRAHQRFQKQSQSNPSPVTWQNSNPKSNRLIKSKIQHNQDLGGRS